MRKNLVCSIAVLALVLSIASTSAAVVNPSGNPIWTERSGLGVTLGIGGGDCFREYCRYTWDTSMFPSVALFVGMMYRLNTNWVFFGEFHNGFANSRQPFRFIDNADSEYKTSWMLFFDFTAGAEFHLPTTGWLDLFLGGGIGFAYLGGWAEDGPLPDTHHSLKGFNFQIRGGMDLYLFSAAPNFSLGPMIKVGLPIWGQACVEEDGNEICHGRGDFDDFHSDTGIKKGELPFTLFLGFISRYVF